MSMAIFLICLVSVVASLISFRFNRRKPAYFFAFISFVAGIIAAALVFLASTETGEQIQLAHTQAEEASVQADKAQAQITEIRTPRRMEPGTKRMLVARLKPYAGQKYDMQVFRDQDSLELASTIQAVLEEAGWVYTLVYPRYKTHYAETRDDGVWLVSGETETSKTSKARTALHGTLIEAGLYDDSSAFHPVSCVKNTGPIEIGTKLTRIPCSESSIQDIEFDFTSHDDVIPEDTLVLHVGKERL